MGNYWVEIVAADDGFTPDWKAAFIAVMVLLGVTIIMATVLLIHCQKIKKRLQVENESYKKAGGGGHERVMNTDRDKGKDQELVKLGAPSNME